MLTDKAIKNACYGYNKARGGLDLTDLQKHFYPILGKKIVKQLNRMELLQLICERSVEERRLLSYGGGKESNKWHDRQAKYYATVDDIKRRIYTTKEYRDMRPQIKEIEKIWSGLTCCQLCGIMVDTGQLKEDRSDYTEESIRMVIDHIHFLEEMKTGINPFRGFLCHVCNLAEGDSRDITNDFYERVKILSDTLKIQPEVVYKYLYDTFHGHCPMDTNLDSEPALKIKY